MAVPKKKRYKQIVRSRRSLQKINLILKKNLFFNKFSNFVNISEKFVDNCYCIFCKNNALNKQYCLSCFNIFTAFIWRIEAKERRHRLRDLNHEYYVKLARQLNLRHFRWVYQ